MKKLILRTLSLLSVAVLGTLVFVACSKTPQEVEPSSKKGTKHNKNAQDFAFGATFTMIT